MYQQTERQTDRPTDRETPHTVRTLRLHGACSGLPQQLYGARSGSPKSGLPHAIICN